MIMVGCLEPGARDDILDAIKYQRNLNRVDIDLEESLVREGALSAVILEQTKRIVKMESEVFDELEKMIKAVPTCPKRA